MNKLVVLTILLVTAVTESKAQNKSSDHELVNEVNHVQVGVCLFEKEFKIMRAWVPRWIFDVSIIIGFERRHGLLQMRLLRKTTKPFNTVYLYHLFCYWK